MLRRHFILLIALLAAPFWVASRTAAATPYDGLWSVLIITDSGTCDRGYRYALRIVNGRVTYDDPSFDVSGRVAPGGQVSVSVRHGQSGASGTGRLSAASGTGAGRWSGMSGGSRCAGHWEAEKRG